MITVPYWWHATLLELLWLTGGLISTWFTALNLRDSWQDQRVLDDLRKDSAVHERHYLMVEIAARGRTASQVFRLVISALIVSPGLVGCATANPLGGKTTALGFVVTVCLDGIALLTAWRAYSDMRERRELYELAAGRSAVLAAQLKANGPVTKGTP